MRSKSPAESMIEMNELVLPNDANLLGNLLGGRLLHWVDIAGAMAAQRHANSVVATVSIDSVDFRHPIKVGEIVTLRARVTWVGRTSMEVVVEVFSEDCLNGGKKKTNKAYLAFVGVDSEGTPKEVPGLLVETEMQRRDSMEAEKRRDERLSRKRPEG